MGNCQEYYETFSEKETFDLGLRLTRTIKPGDSISLEGDLGVGKTALTKGIAKGLGISDIITSPTFTIVNTYEGNTTLNHFDVYRINDPEELFEIGWEEYFNRDAVCIIEWGDRVQNLLPPDLIRIKITRDDEDLQKRRIIIERQAEIS